MDALQQALQQEDYQAAFRLCRQAGETDAAAWDGRGVVLASLGFPLSAANRFRQAIQRDPADPLFRQHLEQVAAAARAFHQAVRIPRGRDPVSAVTLISRHTPYPQHGLADLLRKTPEVQELILVVHESSPESAQGLQALRQEFPQRTQALFTDGPAAGPALRAAVSITRSPWLLLAAPSLRVTAGWLARLAQAALAQSAGLAVPVAPQGFFPELFSENDTLEEYAQQQALKAPGQGSFGPPPPPLCFLLAPGAWETLGGIEADCRTWADLAGDLCQRAEKARLGIWQAADAVVGNALASV